MTKTEELKKQLELAVENITYKVTITPPGNSVYQFNRNKLIEAILQTCKDAGLVFMDIKQELWIPDEIEL